MNCIHANFKSPSHILFLNDLHIWFVSNILEWVRIPMRLENVPQRWLVMGYPFQDLVFTINLFSLISLKAHVFQSINLFLLIIVLRLALTPSTVLWVLLKMGTYLGTVVRMNRQNRSKICQNAKLKYEDSYLELSLSKLSISFSHSLS